VPNFYTSRESVKRALNINGIARDTFIDESIEAMSREIDRWTRRIFIPKTQTRLYEWPARQSTRGYILWLDFDLLSITTLQTKAQDSSPTTIASTDYFLEPNNDGPPYDRIEIDLSSTAAWESGDTPQRSISVAGSWGYSDNTRSVGTVSSGLANSAAATALVCSDASVIDVGDTLLIESEQTFVSERAFADLAKNMNDASITASVANNSLTGESGHGVLAGETIRLDDEEMFVESVSGTTIVVARQYNGTLLASHATAVDIFINRTLTIERAVNGTTAVTHADATAISKYEPEFNIRVWCRREAIAHYLQESAGWGRETGQSDVRREFRGVDITARREMDIDRYEWVRMAAV